MLNVSEKVTSVCDNLELVNISDVVDPRGAHIQARGDIWWFFFKNKNSTGGGFRPVLHLQFWKPAAQ